MLMLGTLKFWKIKEMINQVSVFNLAMKTFYFCTYNSPLMFKKKIFI